MATWEDIEVDGGRL